MTSLEPAATEDDAMLEAFLSRPSHPEGTLSLGEVRGFIFALAAAPELVKPSEWLPLIFGGEEPDFDGLEEAQPVLGALMALYNDINSEVREEGERMPDGCEFHEEPLANLEPDATVSQWSRGFRLGHLFLAETWDAYLPEELEQEHKALLATLIFFASRSAAERVVEEFTNADASLESVALTFRDLFPAAVARYAAMGTSIWDVVLKRDLERPGPAVAEPRVGRNDPCPCGSGRKYKKCCGAEGH